MFDLIDFGVPSPYEVGEFFQASVWFWGYDTNLASMIFLYFCCELYELLMANFSGQPNASPRTAADSPFFVDPGEASYILTDPATMRDLFEIEDNWRD